MVSAAAEDTGTRAQILGCAAGLFRAQGYAAVSLRDIAKGVGLTTGSLYYHFGSKEEIVSEILEQGHLRVLRDVERNVELLGSDADPRELIRAAIHTHISCLIGDDSFPSANIRIFAHVPSEIRHASLGARREYESYWARLIKRCQSGDPAVTDIEPAILINLLFGAMNWTLEWFKPGRHSVSDIADDLTRLVIAPHR